MADPVRVISAIAFHDRPGGPPGNSLVYHVHPDDLARAIRREMAAEIEVIRDDLRKGVSLDDALRWSHDRLTAAAPRAVTREESALLGAAMKRGTTTIHEGEFSDCLRHCGPDAGPGGSPPAPREPAQERQEAGERGPKVGETEIERLTRINRELVRDHNTLLIYQSRQEDIARAAGFAEGVEAAAKVADGYDEIAPEHQHPWLGSEIGASIRNIMHGPRAPDATPPAAPDPLRPGLRAARELWDTWRTTTKDEREFEEVLDAEIARREGGA